MYRKPLGKAGATEPKARARAINAMAWEPPPGMVKLLCQQCGYWFSAPGPDTPLCADCAAPPREADDQGLGRDAHTAAGK